jgi:hypothetical protein
MRSSRDKAIFIQEEQRLRQELQKKPESTELQLSLSEALLNQRSKKKLLEARGITSEVIERTPGDSFPLVRRAQVNLALHDYVQVESDASKALEIDSAAPYANFLIAQAKLGQLLKVDGAAAKRNLYHESLEHYENESLVNESFSVNHAELAKMLYFGRLINEAHYESTQDIKLGHRSPLTLILFLLTNTFLWFGLIIFFVTALLLMGFLTDAQAFLTAIPLTIVIVALSFLIKDTKRRWAILISLVILEIAFMLVAGLSWKSYSDRAFWNPSGKPVITIMPQPTFDWSRVNTPTNTPDGALLAALKANHLNDIEKAWSLYSRKVQSIYGSEEGFKEANKKARVGLAEGQLAGFQLSITTRESNYARIEYETFVSINPYNPQETHKGGTIDLVREEGEWRIDTVNPLIY